jgi:hypothetical protein
LHLLQGLKIESKSIARWASGKKLKSSPIC